ncbi:MAG: hypothetical protein ACRDNT_23255 [Streptosporangiaceae bacterium]
MTGGACGVLVPGVRVGTTEWERPARLKLASLTGRAADRLRKETGRAPIAPARFYSFTDAEEKTKEQIQKARSHPWISQKVPVRGFVYDVHTGRLSEVFPDGETITG